jgi:HEAT repeat protein
MRSHTFHPDLAPRSLVVLLTLVFCVNILRAQPTACSEPADVLEQQLASRNQEIADRAAKCIGDNAGDFVETFHVLIDTIGTPTTPPKVKEVSIWAAGRIAERRRVDPYLAESLGKDLIFIVQDKKNKMSIRQASAYTLGTLSDSLVAAPDNTGRTVAGQSVSALRAVLTDGGDTWAATEQLDFLTAIAQAIGRLRAQGQTAVPEIVRVLNDSQQALHAHSELTKGQTDAIHKLQRAMAATLAEIHAGPANTAPADALLALVEQNDNETVQAAIYALGVLGPRPEIQDRSLPIIRQLDSGDPAVRQVTAYALGRIHSLKYQAESLMALQRALGDDGPQVREAASQAIEQFDPNNSFITVPALTAAIKGEDDPNVRAALAKTIGSVTQKRIPPVGAEDRKVAIRVLSDADSGLKTTLSALSPSDSSYVPMANALVAVRQSEISIRGSWIRNAFTNHPAISTTVVAYLVWVGICLLVLRIWPLKILSWNKLLGRIVDLDIPLPLPVGHLKIPLRHALFIGLLNYHTRVLNAWVDAHAGSVRQSLLQRQTVRERQIYVPLPVSIRTSHTIRVSTLKPEDLRETCDQDRWCIRILGEGGSGKTSLACKLAFWCLAAESDQRISGHHRSLPVLLEPGNMVAVELGTSLSEAVRSQLRATARSADAIDPELYEKLIRTRRVVVLLDGASEMTVFTKQGSGKLEETFPACALIVTARNTDLFGEGGYTDILPQRIDSDHLLPFMNIYLAHLSVEVDDSRLYEACRRLSLMVGKERGITPLLAQMYARTLVRIPDLTSLNSQLPTSVPELMLTYLEVINRAGPGGQFDDMQVQRASKRLAWECIRDTYRPGRGSKEQILYGDDPERISADLFSYLEHGLRLVDTVAGASFQFVLDPLAEYFAAIYLLEHTRAEQTAWMLLLESLDHASTSGKETLGFLLALNDSLEWRGMAMQVPSVIVRDVEERVTQARMRVQVELFGE